MIKSGSILLILFVVSTGDDDMDYSEDFEVSDSIQGQPVTKSIEEDKILKKRNENEEEEEELDYEKVT